jgi:hypothetical protein
MTEATQVWKVMRPIVSPYGRFKRIESHTTDLGIPDVSYTLLNPRGYQGWLELKLFETIGRCPPHLTRDQILWGESEVEAGGSWHLFGRYEGVWLLYNIEEARKMFDGEQSSPIFDIQGRFPLRELLRELMGKAPRL